MRGRIPSPTALKIANGERKDRINDREPQSIDEALEAPPFLDSVGREHWFTIQAILRETRVWSKADADALGIYCSQYSLWREALRQIQENGPTVINAQSGNLQVSPYLRIAESAQDRMLTLEREFGLTPASRTRVKADKQAVKSKLAEFLKKA